MVEELQRIVESDVGNGMSLRMSDEGKDFSLKSSGSFSSAVTTVQLEILMVNLFGNLAKNEAKLILVAFNLVVAE